MLDGYSKKISELGFPGDIQGVNAAVHDLNTGVITFLTMDKYWRCEIILTAKLRQNFLLVVHSSSKFLATIF